MDQINVVLSQLHSILKCKLALFADDKLYFCPGDEAATADSCELQGYNAKNIETPCRRMIFYTEVSAGVDEAAIELAALHIREQLCSADNLEQSVLRLLRGDYSYSDIAAANRLTEDEEKIYFIVISGTDTASIEAELLEIIKNSVDVRFVFKYQENIIALIDEQDVYEACCELQRNILTEIYADTSISIGGSFEQPQQLGGLYNNCIEALLLKEKYGFNQKVLDYGNMLVYRLTASIGRELKQSIVDRVFSSRFIEILNNEMELTIEEMFKNNLNLTDTSVRLYVHRNTLLYRIEKIYKLTGFDLRKFEDAMIFKLAWLMYKEGLR